VTPGVVMDEHLAHITDEGQNSSNAQELRDHVDGKRFTGMAIENLIDSVVRAEERVGREMGE
jgi:hypothetical protein